MRVENRKEKRARARTESATKTKLQQVGVLLAGVIALLGFLLI